MVSLSLILLEVNNKRWQNCNENGISKESSERTRTSKILKYGCLYLLMTLTFLPCGLVFLLTLFLIVAGIACLSVNICGFLTVQVIHA